MVLLSARQQQVNRNQLRQCREEKNTIVDFHIFALEEGNGGKGIGKNRGVMKSSRWLFCDSDTDDLR